MDSKVAQQERRSMSVKTALVRLVESVLARAECPSTIARDESSEIKTCRAAWPECPDACLLFSGVGNSWVIVTLQEMHQLQGLGRRTLFSSLPWTGRGGTMETNAIVCDGILTQGSETWLAFDT